MFFPLVWNDAVAAEVSATIDNVDKRLYIMTSNNRQPITASSLWRRFISSRLQRPFPLCARSEAQAGGECCGFKDKVYMRQLPKMFSSSSLCGIHPQIPITSSGLASLAVEKHLCGRKPFRSGFSGQSMYYIV